MALCNVSSLDLSLRSPTAVCTQIVSMTRPDPSEVKVLVVCLGTQRYVAFWSLLELIRAM